MMRAKMQIYLGGQEGQLFWEQFLPKMWGILQSSGALKLAQK